MEEEQQTQQQQWLVDFGQRVDLTARLREILLNYPEGTSILKEIVQNADDAKATRVRFVLDHNTYGTGSLLSPELAQFQGPALLAYNDGVFTEKDFESISKIGDSKKREQAGKTGRFGVGFNSVYHVTDLPGFVSGEHLVFFDPHCKYLPSITAANPGKKIDFVAHPVNSKLSDQVAPFHLFGCNTRQHFQGTLFRFPLRTEQQAAASTISKQVYTPAAISSMFSDLRQEASLVLLFLKSVCSIEVLELQPGQKEPQLLFSCSVANRSRELLQQRALFSAAVTAPADQQVSGTYRLELVSRDASTGAEQQQLFLISQRRGPPQLLAMANDLSRQFQVPLIAWGAVAADITPENSSSSSDGSAADEKQLAAARAFCFLPLPAHTGLPDGVHCNGFFELSSNRRDVWHGSDMSGAGRLRAQWNEALLQLVVAPAYLELLAAAANALGPGPQFTRLWPSHDAPEPWQGIVRQLYGHMPGRPLLWTPANGGQWRTTAQCVFPDAACLEQTAGAVSAGEQQAGSSGGQQLQTAAKSAGATAEQISSRSSSDRSKFGPLGAALVQLGMPLAALPARVLAMMAKYLPELPIQCTPAAARKTVKASATRIPQLERQQHLVPLLAYCLSDLDLSAGPTGSWLQQLVGLRLLPLADGQGLAEVEVTTGTAVPRQLVFVVTEPLELMLVKSQSGLLLDAQLLGPALAAQVQLLASFDTCNLKHLSVQHLVTAFLPRILPRAWQHKRVVSWTETTPDGTQAPPATWEWLLSLWQWLASGRHSLEPLAASGWPLLPVLGSQLVALQPLERSAVVLPGADAWPEGLAEVLQKLGVHVLHTASFELPVETLKGQHYVHTAAGTGVAEALAAALKLGSQQQGQQQQQAQDCEAAISKLAAQERSLLRGFLLQPTWFAGAANAAPQLQLRRLAGQLPLYELANSSQQQVQVQAASAAAGAEEPVQLEPVFVGLQGSCCLAPAGVSHSALTSSYVLAATDQQASIMVSCLGVQAPSAAQVYRSDVLPRLQALPQPVRDRAMLLMLRQLPDLQQQDRGFVQLLTQTAFLPSGSRQLHRPSQLYDPRSPELVALLDPDACFPAPAFCGDVSDTEQARQQGASDSGFSSLAMLQQLGLRSGAQLDTLVQAARYVEKLAASGDEDMAVARGKALLAFLNTEAERLAGLHTAITSAAAAAVAAASDHSRHSSASSSATDSDSNSTTPSRPHRPHRPGQGLFRAMQKGILGLGAMLQGQDQQLAGAGSAGGQPEGDEGPSPAQVIAGLWLQLSQLCWCPVLTEPPDAALPWRDGSSSSSSAASGAGSVSSSSGEAAGALRPQRLAAPCAVRPLRDLWLASAVKAVVDGECHSQVALSGLGWNTPLTGAELGSQLAALGLKHSHIADAHLAQQLARIVPQLYMALEELPGTDLSAAAAVLEGQPSVWVGNGFVDASRVALKGSMDLSPHLYVLPLELTPFVDVLAALGVQEAFSVAQYTRLLQDLAAEAAGKPLQPKQLAQALGVTQALADVLGMSGGGATAGKQALAKAGSMTGPQEHGSKQADTVLVPDDAGVMRPACDLAYDDAPWLDGPGTGPDSEVTLVHPRIAAPVAEALGVASRRRLLLAASADCLALGWAGAGGAVEAFGQSEALTTRLRHIIQDYPEGPGVLLELVQNADDAGATEAAFLLDMRQHGTSSLLGPGMAAWQGPALLAYNNAIFGPGDFAAIASIGQDRKMSQPAAIGRFGLGFNAVYHLTDLPSFVSGQHLVLFDPHARYLPGASAAQPGLRINLQRGRLLQQFPDAFSPYMHFGCTMEGSYPGTLFRFPLRSNSTSATSNIKAQPTSPQQALQLLQSLTDVLPQALLFLKALQEIEVYVVGGDSSEPPAAGQQQPLVAGTDPAASGAEEPRLLFRASLKPLDGKESLQGRITHFVSSGGGGSGAQQLDAFFRRLESTKESELPCSMGRVQLSLSVAPSLLQQPHQQQQWQQQSGQLGAMLTAPAGNAEGGVTEIVREDWLVCNQLGGGAARAMALQAWKQEKVKMIPWVGVAAQLATHVDAGMRGSSSSASRSLSCRSSTGGRAFCFLPLPADTFLPCHISSYFELSSNRRDVWHGDDMAGAGQRRARWNEALLESAVAPAYATLLQEAARLLGPCSDFWRLLPVGQGTVPEPWLRVVAALYAGLAGRPTLYSPVDGGKWLPPDRVLLPDAACYSSSNSSSSSGSTARGASSSGNADASTAGAQGAQGAPAAQAAAAGDAGSRSLSVLGYMPPPLQPSELAALLLQCKVPLVMAMSEEQQRCLLQWGRNVAQVTPATARTWMRSQADLVADTLARQQRQQEEQGRPGQPVAAVVLQYCLSDAAVGSNSTPPAAAATSPRSSSGGSTGGSGSQVLLQALQQLQGLKLLPLADGQLQAIQIGLHTDSALAGTSSGRQEQSMHSTVYVTTSSYEQQLLQQLQYHMLHESVSEELRQQLQSAAAAGTSNLQLLSAKRLDSHVLGLLLPSQWHSSSGRDEVSWQPSVADEDTASPAGQQQPSKEFIQLCWHWLADRSDAADVSHWPLLPVTGGKLRLLMQPAQVLRAGDWTEQLMSALTKLGCCLLDTQVLDFPCKALPAFVQEPTAGGLLDALAARQAVTAAATAQVLAAGQAAAGTGDVHATWQQQLQQLSGAERHHLRTYLLQAKWFQAGSGSSNGSLSGLNQQQLQVLRALPVYEVHPPLPYEDSSSPQQPPQPPQQQQGAGLLGLLQPAPPAATSAGLYRALAAAQGSQQLLLAPAGMSNGLVLGSQFLKCESETEEAVLSKHLGVRRLSMQEFLMLHLAKAPQQLEPRALISTVASILCRLRDLSAREPELPLSLKGLPLIPTRHRSSSSSAAASNNAGSSSAASAGASTPQQQQQRQQLVLAAPCELFDPRSKELTQLLSARHFPAAPFDGSVDSTAAPRGLTGATAAAVEAKALLDGLTLCGLRNQLDLEVLLVAAQDIADAPLGDTDAQVRAQLLLHHLDQWVQQHPQPDQQQKELWQRLQTLLWCPVLVNAPEEGLPWPHSHPQEQQQRQQQQEQTQPQASLLLGPLAADDETVQPLQPQPQQQQLVWRAAPKMVAPSEMAWLVSGPLRLLAAPKPSTQLCELLGWSRQQVLRPFTISVQLAQLGEAYPAGTVQQPQLQAKLAAAAAILYSALASYVSDEDQLQLLQTNLLATPCIWVGTGFAYPAVTTLQAPHTPFATTLSRAGSGGGGSEEDHSPGDFASELQQQRLLYLVPQQLQRDSAAAVRTLQALHVAEQWDFAAYAIALAVLGERSAGRALTDAELQLALQLADAAATAQLGSGSTRLLQQDYVVIAANAVKVAAAGPAGVLGLGGADLLVVPDADGFMAAPSDLYFNDATWLGAEGLRLAHAGLQQAAAEALGVRSMRWQHQASESMSRAISCPTVDAAAAAAATVIGSCMHASQHSPAAAAAKPEVSGASAQVPEASAAGGLLGSQAADTACGPVLLTLLSLLHWADNLCHATGRASESWRHGGSSSRSSGSSSSSDDVRHRDNAVLSFNVVLDERQHGTQSLLHSGLSRLQGPALCVTIHGIRSLPPEVLSQLLPMTTQPRPGMQQARSSPAASAGGAAAAGAAATLPAAAGGVSAVEVVQKGLASAWAVTDVVQAMSGDTTCYWDPSGQALAQTVKEMQQQVPRGRSVKHTQPELAQRFTHQWQPWDACSTECAADVGKQAPPAGSSSGGDGSSGSGGQAQHVLDALYLRLPLRLQEQKLQGSAVAAAVGARLGLANRSVGLSLEDVRQQVAAFGPAAAHSLLFLGSLQAVSVSTWPATSPSAVKLWHSVMAPTISSSNGHERTRVRDIIQQQVHRQREQRSPGGPGGLLARLASGARGLGHSSRPTVHKQALSMELVTDYAAAALTQLRAGQQPTLAGPAAAEAPSDPQQQQGHEQGASGPQASTSASAAAAGQGIKQQPAVSSSQGDQQGLVQTEALSWLLSLVCELQPALESSSSSSSGSQPANRQPAVSSAVVAVCTERRTAQRVLGTSAHNKIISSSTSVGILPASGAFSGVALPGGLDGALGRQQCLIDFQGAGASAVFAGAPAQQQQSPATTAAAAAAGAASGTQPAVSAAGPQPQQRSSSSGDGQLDPLARLPVALLVSAWHGLVVMLREQLRASNQPQLLYLLLPDLVAACQHAGDAAAAAAFKQMYQDAASMPIWQLHRGPCVHIQEGAFLPPKAPAAAAAAAGARAAVAPAASSLLLLPSQQAGLGEEARDFIMQQLPLFQVPWPVVAQLEAAAVSGLRIISPSVLRPLLRAQQPKSPLEPHPFLSLTPTQALQLLEYCCSDLTAPEDRPSNGSNSSRAGRTASSGGDAAAATAATAAGLSAAVSGQASAAVDAAAVQASLPANVPQGAASVVADVFGPAGLSVLGGLATQMQQRLLTGVDDVLNLVMDNMGAQQQQQQQQPQPGQGTRQAEQSAPPPGAAHAAANAAAAEGSGPNAAPGTSQAPAVSLAKVAYLKGLPVPTAGGTIAVLGVAGLFVFPPECSPPPTSLLPEHLLRQFVHPDCVAALAWLFRYSDVRQQLQLSFYDLQQLSVHLGEAFGPTWTFADTTCPIAGPSTPLLQWPQAACIPGSPTFPAVVAWDDGAAGGPYKDWLVKLWRVILQVVAAAPEWQNSSTVGPGSSTRAGSGTGSEGVVAASGGVFASAGVAEGLRNTVSRARGIAEVIAGELAQALNVPAPSSATAGAASSSSSSNAAAVAAEPLQAEAEALWRPLLDWPLLPLADGRLLKLRFRQLALAALPEYQQQRQQRRSDAEATQDTQVMSLQEPWDWLLPALCAAGVPVLDPRFNFLIDAAASSTAGTPAAAAAGAVSGSSGGGGSNDGSVPDPGAAAAAAPAAVGALAPVPPLAVQTLLGVQPLIGRPPFSGPLVQKLAATEHTLGGLNWACCSSRTVQQLSTGLRVHTEPWGHQEWGRLFTLLADHPPRDLQPEGIRFLRRLPMFSLVPQPQQQRQPQQQEQLLPEGLADAGPSGSAGGAATAGGPMTPQLVALGDNTGWVLAPAAVLQACAGLRALPSLAAFSTEHVLEHRPGWGELYSILGVEPASLAELLQALLLPYLTGLSTGDRLTALQFIRAHWSQARQYSGPLSTIASFAAALKDIAFLPAAQASAGAPVAAHDNTHSTRSSSIGQQTGGPAEEPQQLQQERLYKPSELFDPSVPLFAAVMATAASAGALAGGSSAAEAVAAGGGAQLLLPAPPYNADEWLRFLRDLGLQHKVTRETFMQLAQQAAQQAAALARQGVAPTAAAGAAGPAVAPASAAAVIAAAAAGAGVGHGFVDVTGADAGQLQRVQASADALVGHLKSHWTALGQDRPWWQELGRVRFWPCTLGVPGSRSARLVFAAANSAAQHKDWPLVWSVQPLLEPQRVPTQLLAQQLGLRSPPALSAVLQHLQTIGQDGGEDLLASWPDSIEPFSSVTASVLQHLDKEGLSPQQAMQLSGAAFIPVAHASRLVAPQQLFLKLGGAALAPFAWEVPGQFAGYAALLRLLGVRDEPRAEDLVQALWRLAGQLSGRRMNPNELAACIRLLSYLSSKAVSSADAAYLASARRSNRLLVPTAGALLMPSSRVVHMGGAGGSMAAARLLGQTDPRQLVLAHPQLAEHVCRWLGVPALSDCLVEELDPAQSDLSQLEAIGAVRVSHLRSLLSSPEFAAAAWSVAAAYATAVPALRQLDLGSVTRLCAAAGQGGSLQFVQRLATKVVLHGSKEDVTRNSASREVYEFYEQAADSAGMGVMYVAQPPAGLPLSALLAQVLSRALGCPFTLPLHPLLEVADASQLAQLQPVLHAGGYDSDLEGALAAGHVGAPLQPGDRALLRLRPLRHYEAGELVAVKRRLTAAAAAGAPPRQAAAAAAEARAAAARPADAAGTAAGGSAAAGATAGGGADEGGMVLCYGRVAVDAAPQPGQAAYRLTVEVAPGVYESLLSTQVFSFQSGAQGAQPPQAAAAEPEASTAIAATAGGAASSGGGGTGAAAGDGAGSGTATQQASELASAVADMLGAAGMPLDLDKQQLLQTALAANAQLQQATAAVAELRQEAARKDSELEAARSSWQCRVCFSRDVEQAFVGCGHMYCSGCMPSLQRCPVCRKTSQKIKLFR